MTNGIGLLTTDKNFFCAALRIHVSESCRDILEKLGGFQLTFRGQINMKVSFSYSTPLYKIVAIYFRI